MSKFKKNFTLKQHTPIIHFQSEQRGATLRASELKPKFDRFLKKYAFGGNVPNEYKIDKDRDALNYKVKIDSRGQSIINFEKYPPLYFGRDNKQKIIYKSVEISFITFNTKLLEIIQNSFKAFLANTNFGTRQSKGYGCYYIENEEFDTSLITSDKSKCYYFDSNEANWESDIKLFYSLLRAGVNQINFRTKQSEFYAKSLMFLYAKNKGLTWDKKAIKEHFINHQQPTNAFLFKDLLGLSTFENWGIDHRLKIKKDNDTIKRYKSPIVFKPIFKGDLVRIYFYANPVNKNFLNTNFKISAKGKPLFLKTPSQFDMNDFLKKSFDIELSQHIEAKYHKHKNFHTLNKIFKTLKVQNAN
jgi:hypothetical protein